MKGRLAELRAITGHSAAWCAATVGHVSKRTWLYWEAGRNGQPPNPPADVIVGMETLANAVQTALKKIGESKMGQIKMDVRLFDHPHLTAEEIEAAENAAADYLAQYPSWLLKEIQEDDREMLDEGIERAERGASAWRQIEDASYSAALAALHAEKWHSIPEAMHLEISFWR